MNLAKEIIGQFKQPHGMLGMLAGAIMANRPSNIERNEWTLELLSLKPTDRLLEIGFGPGIAIEKAARVITSGAIIGIDHSATMMRQAMKRNTVVIKRGTVQLHLGTIESLPSFDKPFDKICSANVVQFWNDPVAVFGKLHGMLSDGGIIATTYMPRHRGASAADAHKKALEIAHYLKSADFRDVRIEEKHMAPISAICVLATR